MRASLPMYTFDPTANAALWRALAAAMEAEGIEDVPSDLGAPDDLAAHWRAPDLLLSQTCGYPLVMHLKREVAVLGTFVYAAPGCDGARYSSAFIARADDPAQGLIDFRDRRVAYNGVESQSGYNCLRAAIAPLAGGQPFFADTVRTGAHYLSLQAVANGDADLAAIDCVSFAGFIRREPDLGRRVRVMSYSAAVPGLPLITQGATDTEMLARLRRAIAAVIADPALAPVRDALFLAGFEIVDFDAYDVIRVMEADAIAAGYPALA
jgi:ABC-type phosphate/phosphonate transport system substrate-binding protein